jgi:acetolactate synthase-1/2/3 large subunit
VSIVDDIARAAHGIAFGIPGGGPSLEVADAIERSGGKFHTTRFEGSAALMAGAVGRLTGRAGVAVSIKGPGLANLAAGLATAALEDFPVLAVAEAFGRSDPLARAHKRIDHGGLVAAFAKGRCGLQQQNAVASLAALATAERPGPVLLELADTDASLPSASPAVAMRDLGAVLRSIEASARPIVVAGGLAIRQNFRQALNALAVPVFSTAGAKGVVDETQSHAAGVYTGAGMELAPERAILAEADLVVGIGLRTHELLVTGFKIKAVNVDDLDAAPGFDFDAVAPLRDASTILQTLLGKAAWSSDLLAAKRTRMRETLCSGPFLPAQVFELVSKSHPRSRIVLDTGFFCTIGEHLCDVRAPDLYLSSGQGRSMGAALPMAVAAAVVRRDAPTILAIGDGGIGMFAAELSLAVAERAPLLVLFMRDGTYASVLERAIAKGLTRRPLTIGAPDWSSVAAAMGYIAGEADSVADAAAFIDRWEPGAGPAFLTLRFDPEPYRIMTRELRS